MSPILQIRKLRLWVAQVAEQGEEPSQHKRALCPPGPRLVRSTSGKRPGALLICTGWGGGLGGEE